MKVLEIIGLQGAFASGQEETFDGQPMQRGLHLRWSFAPELGFPPGGFWLCRKQSDPSKNFDRQGRLRPPQLMQEVCRRAAHDQPKVVRERADRPRWQEPAADGWEYLSQPFVLPITLVNWPARYAGAPDPFALPASEVIKRDIEECHRRLNGLLLESGMPPATMDDHLRELRGTLYYLLRDYPKPPLQYDHPLLPSDDRKHAPALGINIMQQLLLLALNPYFARVLGLYFVDETAHPDAPFDYCVFGCWNDLPCATRVVPPGGASGSGLAKGDAQIGGLHITLPGSLAESRLWRRLRDDANGNYAPKVDPSAPPDVAQALEQCVAGLAQKDQPPALLAADPQGPYALAFADLCRITIARPVSAVGIQLAGKGVINFYSDGAVIGSKAFNSTGIMTLYFESPSPHDSPVDELLVRSEPQTDFSFPPKFTKSIVRMGNAALYLLAFNYIGARWALLRAPGAMKRLTAPDQPVVRFRQREATVIDDGPHLEPRSFFEVLWAAQVRPIFAGHGALDGVVPPPTQPIGFRARREDTSPGGISRLLSGIIAVVSQPTPKNEPRVPASARMHRTTDTDVPDPKGDYVYRVAAFDAFGALGFWSQNSAPINVERTAAAPTLLRAVNFDNTPAAGGAPSAAGDAWNGGTLTLDVGWSAAAGISFPDASTTRLFIQAADEPWQAFVNLLTHDLLTPKFVPHRITVNIAFSPDRKHAFVHTFPVLPEIDPNSPAGVLVIVGKLADGAHVVERYIARPAPEASQGNAVVIHLLVSEVSRILANPSLNIVHAYFIPGATQRLSLAVPLSVHINKTVARGVVWARSSRANPFDAFEKIVNPNTGDARPEPDSVKTTFIGPQRLVPPAPPSPLPSTKHEYYDPADFYGRATRVLPFATTKQPGVTGFVLLRAPANTLFLADMQRRAGNVVDNGNLSALVPGEKFDLDSWLASIGDWLSAFNQRSGKAVSPAQALNDENARRSFVEHFYGGLMDSELRALADIAADRSAFARVDAPAVPLSDTIDGKGFERVLYKLAAVNAAGISSGVTAAAGPYYTRIVTPPRAPVLAKIASTPSSLTIEWTASASPDIAAYLVYRAENAGDLVDLRFFGPDPARPLAPSALGQLVYAHTQRPAMKFAGAPVDPRIRALVADPRLFARDFEGSDRAEVPLPDGVNEVFGVYRVSEFDAAANPMNQPGAFNYWRPVPKGSTIANAPQRVKGLRVGLGRGVPVVAVAEANGNLMTLGALASRRVSFTDEAANPEALAGTTEPALAKTYYYAVVAVDIFGNRSAPSQIFFGGRA